MTLQLDHITITAPSLQDGVQYVHEILGIDIPKGGEHLKMGTHNHLLRVGDDIFLEVIAINPEAPTPGHPRWFGLDHSITQPPRLATWVARTGNIESSLRQAPVNAGEITEFSRGDVKWLMSIPADGSMPFEGAYPALIEWPKDGTHPATRMQDLGCRLVSFTIEHPDIEALQRYLLKDFQDSRVIFKKGGTCVLAAEIETPNGVFILR